MARPSSVIILAAVAFCGSCLHAAAQPAPPPLLAAPTPAPAPTPSGKSHDALPPELATGLIAYEDSGVIKVIDLKANITASYDLPERMEWPAWNPDGKRFTYTSGFGVSLLDIPAQMFMALSAPGRPGGRASWSGDGTRVVYELRGDAPGLEIYDTRDKSRRALALALRAKEPAWSPKGDRLAFVAEVDGTDQVFVVDAPCLSDSTCDKPTKALAPTQVTRGGKGSRAPAWSPDAARLALERDQGDGAGTGIFVVGVDGSGLRRLSPSGSDDHAPSWPRADALAFQRGSESASVCLMKTDGGGTWTVVKGTGRTPSWWPGRP